MELIRREGINLYLIKNRYLTGILVFQSLKQFATTISESQIQKSKQTFNIQKLIPLDSVDRCLLPINFRIHFTRQSIQLT